MLRRAIHFLERAHWQRETRRVTHPFAWGIEHLGGDPARDDPRAFLHRYADDALRDSDRFFAVKPAKHYEFKDGVLTFPSAIESPYRENNRVVARWFPARASSGNGRAAAGTRRAVLVLPQWNAEPDAHVNICRVLSRFGINALRLSLPYHDERKPPGVERADPMVSPNIGLTLQATRQAVLDARRAVCWLERQGYDRLGILGTSIGSAVAFITTAHEPALRAGVFLHVSTYFADVVRTGMVTAHVWEGLKAHVSPDEIRHFWAPISPYPFVSRMKGAGKKLLLVSGRYDLSFLPEFSCQLWQALAEQGIPHEVLQLSCGHYTLAKPPFSYWAGLRFIPFLRRALA
ncbi:MAG TPA: prolyl oligopeptidase family serine peptidase [Candidatus Acidoferrales bacterium]|nr:prolyl oligopeptidase family serine peptidase [Candidatus Acidoferrales bacterium]